MQADFHHGLLMAMLTQDRLLQAPDHFRIFIDSPDLLSADLADRPHLRAVAATEAAHEQMHA